MFESLASHSFGHRHSNHPSTSIAMASAACGSMLDYSMLPLAFAGRICCCSVLANFCAWATRLWQPRSARAPLRSDIISLALGSRCPEGSPHVSPLPLELAARDICVRARRARRRWSSLLLASGQRLRGVPVLSRCGPATHAKTLEPPRARQPKVCRAAGRTVCQRCS